VKTAYVGFTTDTREDWESYCPTPTPPASYKDPVKIQDWMNKAVEKQAVEAKDKPLTGKITGFHLFELEGHISDKGAAGWPGRPVLTILSNYKRIFVVRAGIMAVLSRMEYIDRNATLGACNWIITSRMTHFPLIYEDPKNAPKIFDPIDLLVSSTAEENCDPLLVLARLQKPLNMAFPGAKGATAADWARLSMGVAMLLGE